MSDPNAKTNPILAIAIQAQSAEQRQARRREQAARADRQTGERYRRLAKLGEQVFSSGIPTVCTIH